MLIFLDELWYFLYSYFYDLLVLLFLNGSSLRYTLRVVSGPNLLLPDENNVLYGDLELLFISKLINGIEIYKYQNYFNIFLVIILSPKMF